MALAFWGSLREAHCLLNYCTGRDFGMHRTRPDILRGFMFSPNSIPIWGPHGTEKTGLIIRMI